MTLSAAYALGFFTLPVALFLWAIWSWGLEGLGRWWRLTKPTMGRLWCFIRGHAYSWDNGWAYCRRCGTSRLLERAS